MDGNQAEQFPDPEVAPKAQRRQFSAGYKRRILQEYEACVVPGQKGALLRSGRLCSPHITIWRRQRERGELEGLATKKRGPKADLQTVEIARLKRENERLRKRLEQAELTIDVQKSILDAWSSGRGEHSGRNGLIEQAEMLAQTVGVTAHWRS